MVSEVKSKWRLKCAQGSDFRNRQYTALCILQWSSVRGSNMRNTFRTGANGRRHGPVCVIAFNVGILR